MKDRKGNLSSHKKIDRKALTKRRRDAIGLYRKGLTQYQIAKKIGVSFQAISNWVEVYKKSGAEGLKSLGKPGPKIQSNSSKNRKGSFALFKQFKISTHKKKSKPVQTTLDRLLNRKCHQIF